MFAAFHSVIVECWRGNLADARLIAEDTLERALQLGTGFPLAIALATQANVAAYAGQPDETRRAVREALAIFERGSCLAVTVWPTVTLGFLEVSLGDYQAAAATLGPLAAAAAAMGYGEPTAAPFAPDAAEALVGAGRLDEAATLVDQLESNGRRLDRAWALALGARCRSLLLAATGDLDSAAGAAERALDEHRRLPHAVRTGPNPARPRADPAPSAPETSCCGRAAGGGPGLRRTRRVAVGRPGAGRTGTGQPQPGSQHPADALRTAGRPAGRHGHDQP